MHYCVLLITKEIPNNTELERIMNKYRESNVKYDEETEEIIGEIPLFTYDYYLIGGRYNGQLKLKVDFKSDYYNWKYYDREGRNGKMFHSHLLTNMKKFSNNSFMYTEEDYYNSMGLRDNYLYVDGARICDIVNFDDVACYICIDSEGNAIARSSWDGNNWVEDEQFEDKLRNIKNYSKNYFATILDIHN